MLSRRRISRPSAGGISTICAPSPRDGGGSPTSSRATTCTSGSSPPSSPGRGSSTAAATARQRDLPVLHRLHGRARVLQRPAHHRAPDPRDARADGALGGGAREAAPDPGLRGGGGGPGAAGAKDGRARRGSTGTTPASARTRSRAPCAPRAPGRCASPCTGAPPGGPGPTIGSWVRCARGWEIRCRTDEILAGGPRSPISPAPARDGPNSAEAVHGGRSGLATGSDPGQAPMDSVPTSPKNRCRPAG